MIKLKNICAGYGKKQVLFDVSAVFEKGCVTSLIGPNGCGKSTLLKTLIGLIPLKSGEISLDGNSVSALRRQEIALLAAYLSQSNTTPDMTVSQTVLHGRFPHLNYPRVYGKRDLEIADKAINQMGLADVSDERMSSLSGGMRQSAYIAMALAQSTNYILLDEPTTYLDIANRLKLMETLKSLADNGKGIVTVLHDLTLALEFSDIIIVMADGQVVLSGTPDEIYSSTAIRDVFGVSVEKCVVNGMTSYYYTR